MHEIARRRLDEGAAERAPGDGARTEDPLDALLALQRSAGNHAVATLARQPDLATLFSPSSHTPLGRKRAVMKLGPGDTARALLQLRAEPNEDGRWVLDLPEGSFLIERMEREDLRIDLYEQKEQFFTGFANRRRPLYDAMQAAADPTARHEAIAALSAFDAGELPALMEIREAYGGRWDIMDEEARDAVLAAMQLQAATDAQGELLSDFEKVRDRVKKNAGMETSSEWCGFFSGDHLVKAKLDDDLRAGFFHTANVVDFFHYKYESYPTRIKKWIWDEKKGWQELGLYHQARGMERQWLEYADVAKGGELDIRPGDMVLIDPDLDGTPDHIVLASSYDPATGVLVTIGGNDWGFIAVPAGTTKKTDPATDADRAVGEAATGMELQPGGGGGKVAVGVHHVVPPGTKRGAVYGVGRPSLIDFEEHLYAFKPLDKPPPPPKTK